MYYDEEEEEEEVAKVKTHMQESLALAVAAHDLQSLKLSLEYPY